jgi:nitrite reductase/ring-hydroxylating ferredoxin subunit
VIYAVADVADVAPGTMLHVEVEGHQICLYNIDGDYYATADICTHRRARLSDGYLDGHVVQCPLHFGKFDVTTGRPLNPPCKIPVDTYAVSFDNQRLLVDLPRRETTSS